MDAGARPRPPAPTEVEWLICRAHLREVRNGRVRCPLTHHAVRSLASFIECPELQLTATERALAACSTPDSLSRRRPR
jgi:hypothetical protein